MVLDEVEGHLNRCHPELVGAKEEHWEPESFHQVDRGDAPMIAGIVQDEDSLLSPECIFNIKMVAELRKEVTKGLAICHPYIHGIEEFTSATESSYQVDA